MRISAIDTVSLKKDTDTRYFMNMKILPKLFYRYVNNKGCPWEKDSPHQFMDKPQNKNYRNSA